MSLFDTKSNVHEVIDREILNNEIYTLLDSLLNEYNKKQFSQYDIDLHGYGVSPVQQGTIPSPDIPNRSISRAIGSINTPEGLRHYLGEGSSYNRNVAEERALQNSLLRATHFPGDSLTMDIVNRLKEQEALFPSQKWRKGTY